MAGVQIVKGNLVKQSSLFSDLVVGAVLGGQLRDATALPPSALARDLGLQQGVIVSAIITHHTSGKILAILSPGPARCT